MTLNDYLSHYFVPKEMGIFFLLALGGLIVSLILILSFCKILVNISTPIKRRDIVFYEKANELVDRFYEMIFSGASILSFWQPSISSIVLSPAESSEYFGISIMTFFCLV